MERNLSFRNTDKKKTRSASWKQADSVSRQEHSVRRQTGPDPAGRQTGSVNRQAGSVNRQTGSVNRQAGSVNRQTGSVNRQTGSVNRQTGSVNRQAGSVNRQTGSVNRQTGYVNRQAGSANRPGGPVRKRKRRRSGCLPRLLIVLGILLILVLVVRSSLRAAFGKIEKYSLDESGLVINDDVRAMDKNMGDYQNIALFGVDSQDNVIREKGSRTDCIIVASIHKKTKKVKLMSIFRDTYVSINGNYDKINAAYSYGGPELAISTINRNLDLDITDFATVNFKALADAVDIVGGIPLPVQSKKERKNLNDYIRNMTHINGVDSPTFEKPDDYPFTAVFDGNQAVAYSRIRYMEGGDHARAGHQRMVVEGLVKAVKKKPWKIKKIIDTVLPQCVTSLSTNEMMKMSLGLFRYQIADSQAYPFRSEDERYNGIYYGFPLTAADNVAKAHEYLFGTGSYEPTEEMGKISNKIETVTDAIGLYP